MRAQGELRGGASLAALRRFNAALTALPAPTAEASPDAAAQDNPPWRARLTAALAEFCFNLESFNPVFAHVVLMVQKTIGHSDYERRDAALKRLIVPLAGEYGMHNGEAQSASHCIFLLCLSLLVRDAAHKRLCRWWVSMAFTVATQTTCCFVFVFIFA